MIIGNGEDRCPRCKGKVAVSTSIVNEPPPGWTKSRSIKIKIECFVCNWSKVKYIQVSKMLVV